MKQIILSLTFVLSFSFLFAQWYKVGPTVQSFSQNASFTIIDGTLYAAYTDIVSNGKVVVEKYNGSDWELVGVEVTSTLVNLVTLDSNEEGDLYCAYATLEGKINVKTFNGSDWENVGLEDFANGYSLDILSKGDDIFVAISDADFLGSLTVLKYSGTNWTIIGGSGFTSNGIDFPSLAINNDNVYIAYRDFNEPNQGASVRKYNENTDAWELVGDAGFTGGSSQYVSLKFLDDTPYVVFKDGDNSGKSSLMAYNSGSNQWSLIGSAGFSDGISQFHTLGFVGDSPYVGFNDDANMDLSTVSMFDGNNWVQVGSSFGTGFTSHQDLIINGSRLYCGFVDQNSDVVVYAYDLGCDIVEMDFETQNVSCFGDSDGIATLDLTNAADPLNIMWSGGGNGLEITDLSPGDYSATIIDGIGCELDANFSILQPDELEITVDEVMVQIGQDLNGSISISVSGGTEDGYSFVWELDGNAFSTDEDLSGLASGEYCVTVSDANDCTQSICEFVEWVDTFEPELNKHIDVFPNPTSDFLNISIDLPSFGLIKIGMFDALGKQIFSTGNQYSMDFDYSFNTANIHSGLYLLKIKVDEKFFTQKVVIQN